MPLSLFRNRMRVFMNRIDKTILSNSLFGFNNLQDKNSRICVSKPDMSLDLQPILNKVSPWHPVGTSNSTHAIYSTSYSLPLKLVFFPLSYCNLVSVNIIYLKIHNQIQRTHLQFLPFISYIQILSDFLKKFLYYYKILVCMASWSSDQITTNAF